MLWGSTKALNVAKLATLHAFLLTSFSLSDCSSTRDACQRAHTLSGPRPIRGGVRPSLSLIGLDHDISLTGVSFVEPHRVSESRILFFSFLEWLDAPVRPGIFVSRTREKLGCTCDQIGRTLEPCDETAYREEVSTLTKWCQENHLSLNIDKTKELVVDYRRQSREHTPITIDKTPVERVTSFKFLGVHITEDLTWSAHTDAVLKKAHQRLFFLRRLRKFGTSPRILRSFYTCTVESILTGCITAWYGNSTAGNRRALQRVVRTARHIVGGELPSLQDIYTRRCTRKARRIIKDSSHPSHRLLSLLPSGRRFRSIRSRTSRLRDSFFPQAIRLMNSHK